MQKVPRKSDSLLSMITAKLNSGGCNYRPGTFISVVHTVQFFKMSDRNRNDFFPIMIANGVPKQIQDFFYLNRII